MLTGRSYGGVRVMSAPSITIEPSVGSSKPPIMRRTVVLPQPDGPRREKNSPRRMSSETPSTAATSPKRLVTPRIETEGAVIAALLWPERSRRLFLFVIPRGAATRDPFLSGGEPQKRDPSG